MQPDSSDRGQKHLCAICQTKFYDLKRPQALCPRCGADPAATPPPPVRKRARPKPVAVKPAPAAETPDDVDELDGVDDDPVEDEDDVDDE